MLRSVLTFLSTLVELVLFVLRRRSTKAVEDKAESIARDPACAFVEHFGGVCAPDDASVRSDEASVVTDGDGVGRDMP